MINLPETQSNSEIILYQTEDGQTRIQVRLQNETVWMSLNQMTELFQRDKSVISRHIRNIFRERIAARVNCCKICNSSIRRLPAGNQRRGFL